MPSPHLWREAGGEVPSTVKIGQSTLKYFQLAYFVISKILVRYLCAHQSMLAMYTVYLQHFSYSCLTTLGGESTRFAPRLLAFSIPIIACIQSSVYILSYSFSKHCRAAGALLLLVFNLLFFDSNARIPTEIVFVPTEIISLPTEIVFAPTEIISLPTGIVFAPTEIVSLPVEAMYTPTGRRSSPCNILSVYRSINKTIYTNWQMHAFVSCLVSQRYKLPRPFV